MKKQLDNLITGAMVVAALLLTGSYLLRDRDGGSRQTEKPRKLATAEWKRITSAGRTIAGALDAVDTIAVFTDLQCPVCKSFHLGALEQVLEAHPNSVRVIAVHYPLSYHPQAMTMARATECIEEPMLRSWFDQVYRKQDSLPFKSAAQFAQTVGVVDTAGFANCAAASAAAARVAANIALGDSVGVKVRRLYS